MASVRRTPGLDHGVTAVSFTLVEDVCTGTSFNMSGEATRAAYTLLLWRRSRGVRGQKDVHRLASCMPHVTVVHGSQGNPVYQVGGKSFVFFRTPRPDATDPQTGERYTDVVMFWVSSESDKQAVIQDPSSPFFSTTHFDGHPSVLLRTSRIGELTRQELTEVVQDAWLSQASNRRRDAWLKAHGFE